MAGYRQRQMQGTLKWKDNMRLTDRTDKWKDNNEVNLLTILWSVYMHVHLI